MDFAGGYEEYAFVADLYDFVEAYRTRPDVDFFVEAARESGGPVLEVGCGTGRVLIPTARAGIEITGLDLSGHMLEVCKQRMGEEPGVVRYRIQLVQADMRDFELGQRFRLATIPFRPFQHLTTVEDQMSCLKAINQHLVDGGQLIIDLFNPSLVALTRDNVGEELAPEPEFTASDGKRVIRKHKIVARDYFSQVQDVELIYYVTHPDGRQERLVHAFPMRYLFRFEMEHLLARCGFEVQALYADYEKNPYGSKYPGELVFVAVKMREETI